MTTLADGSYRRHWISRSTGRTRQRVMIVKDCCVLDVRNVLDRGWRPLSDFVDLDGYWEFVEPLDPKHLELEPHLREVVL